MRKLLILLSILLYPVSASSQTERLALVIGNSNYLVGAPLLNPENDAEDIALLLQESGFTVRKYINLDQSGMKKAIDEFGSELSSSATGLFFYAGHGIQAKGRNYLVPIDANLRTENDVEYNCVDAGRILAKMEDAGNPTNIIILDACRNNPFERSWSRSSAGSGLAFIEAPGGSLIAYSTAPGTTASDGYGRNSPYTSALKEAIKIPGLKIEECFKVVRSKVRKTTNDKQTPWESTSLEGDFYFIQEYALTEGGYPAQIPEQVSETLATEDEEIDFMQKRDLLASRIKSLAILPFSNYTGDESKEYLALGMQDALINELGRLGQLRVTSRTSTLRYTDFKSSIKEIASELDVDGVIETTLIGLGDNVRIQLKMYSALPDEQQIWSQVYDEDLSDILNLYNKVIKNIADEIKLSLTAMQRQELNKSRKIDPKAYEAYLKGKFYWEKLDNESMQKALDYFQEAIDIEPEWADPYAGLANSWSMFSTFLQIMPRSETEPRVRMYQEKALELDPESDQIHYVKALHYAWTLFTWEESEKEFLKTIELNPNHAPARMYYSHLLCITKRPEEAEVQANIALQLDPFKPLVLWLHGNLMHFVGKDQDALESWGKAQAVDPDYAFPRTAIFNFYMEQAFANGDYDKWMDFWYKKVTANGHWRKESINAVMQVFDKKGHIAAIKEMFKQNKRYGNMAYMSARIKAERYIILGDYDKAIDCLEEDFEKKEMNLAYLLTEKILHQQLKDHPRYIKLLKDMGLYKYI